MPYREYHYRWVFDLKSSPQQIWPFVADTNRFNRDTGVPEIDIDSRDAPLSKAHRRVRLSVYGLPIEWEERPFEWVRPVRFGVERIYSKGPLREMRVLVELTEKAGGGTYMTYEVWAKPRNAIGVAAIPLQIGLKSARKFRAAFQEYDRLALSSADADTANRIPVLSTPQRQRVAALKQRLIASSDDANVAVIERLVQFVEQADELAVARIRPYQLADLWQLSRRAVLETCLRATRVGLLDLQWDLLCPLCRGAKESSASLKEISSKIHCSTCKIDFTVSFDRFVELTFRPNAAIRSINMQEYCVGSPQRTPHVVAQQFLKPRETRLLTVALETGNYRMRALELPGEQAVLVSEGGEQSVLPVVISTSGWSEARLNPAEHAALELRNETDLDQLFILERMEWSDQAATAMEVTALQIFRDLFSTEALRPGEQISVGTLTVLFTDLRQSTRLYREIGDATAFGRVMNHFDVLRTAIAEHDGAIVKTIGDAVMAVFRRPASALVAMLDAQQRLASPDDGSMPLFLKAGLHSGPCIAVTLNDRLDYFGSTVNMAARLEGLSSGADVIISREILEDVEVTELLNSGAFEATGFEMLLKGFEEKCDLWRVKRAEVASELAKEEKKLKPEVDEREER